MEGVTGDSVLILDRPVATGAALCAVKMRPGSCFDPALLEDHGWLVPRNTTHLDLGSMSLCMPLRKVPAPARISWIMDNSGSMQQNDPQNIRFGTIWKGILQQRSLNPSSEAGFVRFSSTIETSVAVAPLNPVRINLLQRATLQTSFTGGTNWELALRAGLKSFDSSQGEGPAAIVMISDGLPNEGVWENAIRPGMPPVYVLYIGNPGEVSSRPEMQSLIRRTGGRLWVLGTAPQQALMDAAVSEIMGLFETVQTPLHATIAAMPMRQNAHVASFQKTIGGAFVGQADSLLAMIDGGNSFDLQLTSQSAGFAATMRSYQFSLSAVSSASPASFDLAGSPFRISCAEPGSLRFVDSLGRGVDWLPTSERSFQLDVSPRLPTPRAMAATASSTRGESQSVVELPRRLEGGEGGARFLGAGPLTAGFPVPGLIIDTLGDTVRATWCHDRVPRDCASGSLALIRVAAAPALRFETDSLEGPRGTMRVEVRADALAPDTLAVEVSGEAGEHLTVSVVRSPDGLHRAAFGFTQVPGDAGPDTIALTRPVAGIPTRVRARVVTGPDSAFATATLVRRRDTLVVEPGTEPGTIRVRLLVPDNSAAGRLVVLTGPAGTDSVVLDGDGVAVRPVRALVGETPDPSRIEAVAVDTLYRDTLRSTMVVEPLPATRIRFVEPLPSGSVGRLWLEASVPSSRQVVRAILAWPQGDIEVYLVRGADDLFHASLPFSRGTGSDGDTLSLPAIRMLELTASIPPGPSWRGSTDAIGLAAPVSPWNVAVLDSGRLEVVSDRVDGLPATILSRTRSIDRRHGTQPSGNRDSTSIATWSFLGESLDSATVEILRIDPVFGDTSRKTLRVASPWNASTLAASPDSVDPRRGDSTLVEVRDLDAHPDAVDSVVVRTADGRAWTLRETAANSGRFLSRIASRDLAADWAAHPYHEAWSVGLFHVDPDHVADTARATLLLVKAPLPPESTRVRIAAGDREAASGRLAIEVVSPHGTDTLSVVVSWSGGRDTLRLVRDRDSAFHADLPYARWNGPGTDTLRLPGSRELGIEVRVLPDSTRLASRDSLHLGSRRSDLVVREREGLRWTVTVPGATGPTSRIVVRTSSSSATLPLRRGASGDSLDIDLDRLLPESRDSIEVEFVRIDPVYGDSVRTTRRVVSPWHAASLETDPDTADVLQGTLVVLTVRDLDPDTARAGTVVVRSSAGTEFVLTETSPSSGVYTRDVPSWLLDTTWLRRAPDSRWTVDFVHVDPDHPGDTARASIELVRPSSALSLTVVHAVHPVATGDRTGPRLQTGPSRFLSTDMSPDQGIEISSWTPVDLDVFVYDAMGVWIARGSFRLDPDPIRFAHRSFLTWDGRDAAGEPVTAGIYLMRVVVRDRQGRLLTNQVFRLGRKAPAGVGGS